MGTDNSLLESSCCINCYEHCVLVPLLLIPHEVRGSKTQHQVTSCDDCERTKPRNLMSDTAYTTDCELEATYMAQVLIQFTLRDGLESTGGYPDLEHI